MSTTEPPKSRRGFASLSPERRREVASQGGNSVPAHKRSFSQDRTLAAEAGRKGGTISASRKPQATPAGQE